MSDKMVQDVYQMHQDHGKKLYKSFDLYRGWFYKMIPELSDKEKEWLNEHVIILDALYGVIKPFKKIAPYRLDFKTKLPGMNLKKMWKDKINKELEGYKIFNLASKEFSSLVYWPLTEVALDGNGCIKQQRGRKLVEIMKKEV